MKRKLIKLGRDPKFMAMNLAYTAMFIGFAVYKWRDGSMFYTCFWSFLGFVALCYSLMMTNAKCPGCGDVLKLDAGLSQYLRCDECGTYVEVEKGKAFTVPEDRVAETPVFAAVIGGPAAEGLNPVGIAAISKVPTMDGGERRLDFRFPEGCCVCGKPHTERQSITFDAVGKGARALGFADERLTFKVEGIPHCEDHRNGAALDIENLKLVLKFRSLPYRNTFRTLNALS